MRTLSTRAKCFVLPDFEFFDQMSQTKNRILSFENLRWDIPNSSQEQKVTAVHPSSYFEPHRRVQKKKVLYVPQPQDRLVKPQRDERNKKSGAPKFNWSKEEEYLCESREEYDLESLVIKLQMKKDRATRGRGRGRGRKNRFEHTQVQEDKSQNTFKGFKIQDEDFPKLE